MRTIERNYRKNPHTANFLMTFHTGGRGLPADAIQESPVEEPETIITYSFGTVTESQDLLDLVPAETVSDLRSPAQANLMDRLVAQITELDAEAGAQARTYTDGMTEHGLWTPGREGKASKWITRMIAKVSELKATARPTGPAPATEVADGRYAVEEGGTLKFFKVKNGRNAGFVFLDIQASDEWHKVSNVTRIRSVLALIAVDADAASLRYGQEIGECGDCGRTLTTAESRARGRGPICDARH